MDHLFETFKQAAFLSLLVSGERRRQVHLIFVCIHAWMGVWVTETWTALHTTLPIVIRLCFWSRQKHLDCCGRWYTRGQTSSKMFLLHLFLLFLCAYGRLLCLYPFDSTGLLSILFAVACRNPFERVRMVCACICRSGFLILMIGASHMAHGLWSSLSTNRNEDTPSCCSC